MIFEKQDSLTNSESEDDESESFEDLQDAENFFQDKNFKFSRRWGELRSNHFQQILLDLNVNE